MTIQVVPAILPQSFDDIAAKAATVKGAVSCVQIDITDGSYAHTETWPFSSSEHFSQLLSQDEGMPFWEDIEYEVDMLVDKPERFVDDWIAVGISGAVIHVESTDMFEEISQKLRDHGVLCGAGILPSTDIAKLEELEGLFDFIQCMGNDEIGRNGVVLDERVYEKVQVLRELYPEMPIAVDIGVNEETAPELVDAGATKLVSGSAIFGSPDPKETITALENLA